MTSSYNKKIISSYDFQKVEIIQFVRVKLDCREWAFTDLMSSKTINELL